ncbi:hypothetical protein Tco_0765846 [Tanacetum coccineum]
MPRFSSNDMAHNHYLEEAKKKTQEINRNSKPSVMHTTSLHNTTNGSKQKPRSNNQTSRSLPVSKSSGATSNSVPLVDHSRKSSSFSDSKHFICLTCLKCVFNANHNACITKFLNEVKSRAKVQSYKTRNSNKPVEPKSNTQKSGWQIFIGHKFYPNKSSHVHEKINTPRSCLRWKPTGRIFKIVGLRCIPTGKIFTFSTTKVDSELPNGSKEDVTNPYKCEQTLNVSACTLNLSAGLVQNPVSLTPYVPPSKKDYEILFQLLFDEYFNPPPRAVSLDLVAVAAPRAVNPADSPLSTTIDQDVPLLLTKHHPLENVIGDPSQPVLTRSQLQEHAIWCYFDANVNLIPFGGKQSG